MHTPCRSLRKILVPPLGVSVENAYPPPGCWKLFRAAGANRTKGASRAAGELRERGILPCSVSLFVCAKNGYPPPLRSFYIFIPPLGNLVRNRYPTPRKSTTPLLEILNSPLIHKNIICAFNIHCTVA